MNLEILWNCGNKIEIMKIVVLIGYIYILYILSENVKNSIKVDKKSTLLNSIGIIFILVYMIFHLFEMIKSFIK